MAGQDEPKYVPARRTLGRTKYCLHILRDMKYIANAVPREVTNRHIRVATKVMPNNLKNRASQ